MDNVQVIPPTNVLFGLVLCVFGLYMILFLRYRIYPETHSPKRIRYPPGPEPWPVLGNLFFFRRLFQSPDKELTELTRQYGDTCMLWFGSQPVMIINTAKDVKQLLDKVHPVPPSVLPHLRCVS